MSIINKYTRFSYNCLSIYNFSYVYCPYSLKHSEIAYIGFVKNRNKNELTYLHYPCSDPTYSHAIIGALDLIYKIFDHIDDLLLAIYNKK